MASVFDELQDTLLETEVIVAHAKVSMIEEYDGLEISFNIEKVLEGNTELKGELFFVSLTDLEEVGELYQAELEICWYEGTSFPKIDCISLALID